MMQRVKSERQKNSDEDEREPRGTMHKKGRGQERAKERKKEKRQTKTNWEKTLT